MTKEVNVFSNALNRYPSVWRKTHVWTLGVVGLWILEI